MSHLVCLLVVMLSESVFDITRQHSVCTTPHIRVEVPSNLYSVVDACINLLVPALLRRKVIDNEYQILW